MSTGYGGALRCDGVEAIDDLARVARVVGEIEDLVEVEAEVARSEQVAQRRRGVPRALGVLLDDAVGVVALHPLRHERDISHSGAERVILPDSTILIDYVQQLAIRVVRGLVVHPDRMLANIELTHGALFSQRVLLTLVESGMQRDDAYRIVQEDAQRAWDTGVPLRDLLAQRDLGLDLDAIFDLAHYTRHARAVVARLDLIAPVGEPA